MRFKKVSTLFATMAICSVCLVNANAAEGQTTELEYTLKNDPTYTVSIPAKLTLEKEGTEFQLEASDVKYLDGQKISVTIAGTDYFRDQMVMQDDETRNTIRYSITKEDGTVIETKPENVNGTEIASFTEDSTITNIVKPVDAINNKVGNYKGSISFNIELTKAE